MRASNKGARRSGARQPNGGEPNPVVATVLSFEHKTRTRGGRRSTRSTSPSRPRLATTPTHRTDPIP